MTWSDPIVEEVRRSRDAYAARFNYDLRAIFRDLKEQEMRSGRKLISSDEIADSKQSLRSKGTELLGSPSEKTLEETAENPEAGVSPGPI
jgi:hypothetical protein